MMHFSLFLAAGLLVTAIILFPRMAYWHERKTGRSHKDSLRESFTFQAVLFGSAVVDYVAVVARYS